jgi:hypothetical protein
MLGECYGRLCPNNRLIAPWRRKEFVKVVCAELQQAWANSPARVVPHIRIIFLGSGSLLQELIILTHLYSSVVIERAEVIFHDVEYAYHNDDEKLLLNARFCQAQEIITSLFPHIISTWSMRKGISVDLLDGSQPTLVCGADVNQDIIQQGVNILSTTKTAITVMLDDEGNIRVINSQKKMVLYT